MHSVMPIVSAVWGEKGGVGEDGPKLYNNLMPDIISYLLSGWLPKAPQCNPSLYSFLWKLKSTNDTLTHTYIHSPSPPFSLPLSTESTLSINVWTIFSWWNWSRILNSMENLTDLSLIGSDDSKVFHCFSIWEKILRFPNKLFTEWKKISSVSNVSFRYHIFNVFLIKKGFMKHSIYF